VEAPYAVSQRHAGPVVVFDGVCVLCSGSAQFILDHDRQGRFRLAAMQGRVGSELLRSNGLDPSDPTSMVVIEGDRVHRDSDAVLAICAGLGWPWRALAALRFVPRPVRDAVYRLIARNRYRIFGKREQCWLPSAERADRMLD